MNDWIRESNLIEGIDSPKEDARCARIWSTFRDSEWGLENILWAHRRMLWVLHRSIGGKTRDRLCVNVRVGNHVAPHWSEVPRLLNAFIYNATKSKTWEEIKLDHIEFESIHPFQDGNGRIGRMIMNWQRERIGLEPLCIKADERHDYYEWFNQARKTHKPSTV